MADQVAYLGRLIPNDVCPDRDCIHLAVIPMIAGEDYMDRGCRIKLKYNTTDVALLEEYNEKDIVGIVDPFLKEFRVHKGQKFWCYLLPNSITGMRHHWQHTKFDEPKEDVGSSESWIREFCDTWNFDYDELVTNAHKKGDWRYVTAMGIDLHSVGELGKDHDLFWMHLEKLNKTTYSEEHREGMGWSCSC